jgi:hypothetical protein
MRQPTEWEKIFANYAWQGINIQNIQGAQKTGLPRNQWPNEEMGKWLNRTFLKEEVQMTKKYTRTCSTSLVIKEMQSKPP